MAQPLSPDTDYKAPIDLELSRQLWDGVFGSIGTRLRALEAKRIELQAIIDDLKGQALTIVSATISTEITAQRAVLAEIQEELEAVQEAYDAIQSGGVFADTIRLRAPISGMTATVVQAALAELQGRFNAQRQITVASLYLGLS